MPQRHKVFFLGVLAGVLSMLMLWIMLFTFLSDGIKLIVFLSCTFIGLILQLYALKDLKKRDPKQPYNLAALHQDVRNYKWFGVFFFGVASPYIASLVVYVVLKQL